MSNPVTQDQVEDVLSSIRRLVSDKERLTPSVSPSAEDNRLVLTPSFRVTEQDLSEPLDLGAVAEDSWPPEAETAEPSQQTTWDDEGDHTDEAFWETPQPAPEPESEPETLAPDAHVASTLALTEKIAALENAIGTFQQEFEPDEAGMGANSGTNASGMAWEDNVELDATGTPLGPVVDAESEEIEDAAASAAPAPQAEEALEEVSEAFELEDEFGAAPFLPRHSHDRENAAAASEAMTDFAQQEITPQALEDAEPVQHAGVAEEDVGGEGAARKAASALDEQLLDEDALRDLIGQIVRAELQGALGERITRNVRKLVRREIYRALAAQELD